MKPQVASRPVRRLRGGDTPGFDEVAVEEPLEIRVAGDPVAVTMRTPGDDAQLAVGFLFAEGVIRSIDDVGAVAHCGRPGDESYGNVLEVTPAPGAHLFLERLDASRRGTLTTAACGVCGRRSIEDLLARIRPVPECPALSVEKVAASIGLLSGAQKSFARTGGVHAAAALDDEGRLVCAFEDVGRHNAVDKVVGQLVYERRVPGASVGLLVVSGRASFEIVQKAASAGIPVVASVSAASSLAIDLAERAGIALCAFVRDGGFNVYGDLRRVR